MTEVTDKMLDAAYDADRQWQIDHFGYSSRESMRAAIEAALAAREIMGGEEPANERATTKQIFLPFGYLPRNRKGKNG